MNKIRSLKFFIIVSLLFFSSAVFIIKHGIAKDPNLSLTEALKNNSIKHAKQALNAGANPNYKINNRNEIVIVATMSDKFEFAKLLIRRGANVNAKVDNGTPLIFFAIARACQTKKTDAVEYVRFLIANGADVNSRTAADITPLCYTKTLNDEGGCSVITSILEKHGAITGDTCE